MPNSQVKRHISKDEVAVLYAKNQSAGISFRQETQSGPHAGSERLKDLIVGFLKNKGVLVNLDEVDIQPHKEFDGYYIWLPEDILRYVNQILQPDHSPTALVEISNVGTFAAYKGKDELPICHNQLQGVLAKQMLFKLMPQSDWEISKLTTLQQPLSRHPDTEVVTIGSNSSYFPADVDKAAVEKAFGEGQCTISKKELKRLAETAKIVTNSSLITPELFLAVQTNLIESIGPRENRTLRNIINYDENLLNLFKSELLGYSSVEDFKKILDTPMIILSSNICHSQEVHFFVEQHKIDGKAYNQLRNENLDNATPCVLLSIPGINLAYGNLSAFPTENGDDLILNNSVSAKKLANNMWKTVLDSAILQRCNNIVMPAIGLGAFAGNLGTEMANIYFEELFKLLEDPQYKHKFNVLFNPLQYETIFKEKLNKYQSNLQANGCAVQAVNCDTKMLAVEFAKKGQKCALLNPSDMDVVLGKYDVGEYYKKGNYVGEEDLAATSTAAIGSREISNCYTDPSKVISTQNTPQTIPFFLQTTSINDSVLASGSFIQRGSIRPSRMVTIRNQMTTFSGISTSGNHIPRDSGSIEPNSSSVPLLNQRMMKLENISLPSIDNKFIRKLNQEELEQFLEHYVPVSICAELGEANNGMGNAAIILADLAQAIEVLMDTKDQFEAKSESSKKIRNQTEAFDFIAEKITQGWLNAIGEKLIKSDDQDVKTAGNWFCKFTDKILTVYGKSALSTSPVLESNTKDMVIYQAKNGEIALRFSNQKQRDSFYDQLIYNLGGQQVQIPKEYRYDNKGNLLSQFKYNPNGFLPVKYNDINQHTSIYFPSYIASNGEIAMNCGNKQNREAILKIMHLIKDDSIAKGGWVSATYTDSNKHKLAVTSKQSNQINAIYFEKACFDPNRLLRVSFNHEKNIYEIKPSIKTIKSEQMISRLNDNLTSLPSISSVRTSLTRKSKFS